MCLCEVSSRDDLFYEVVFVDWKETFNVIDDFGSKWGYEFVEFHQEFVKCMFFPQVRLLNIFFEKWTWASKRTWVNPMSSKQWES